ncbi:MAG: DUF6689 family protein [Acidobacteriota bacterium]
MKPRCFVVAALLATAVGVGAQGIVNPRIVGNEVLATVSLPGGIGAELTLSFENVVGLNLATLNLSAQLVSATDLSLLNRLPAGGLVAIPGAFPVLIRVQPSPESTLSFEGIYTLSLHTENLIFAPNTPLRLFHAQSSGPFEDITETMGLGSYRVRGASGSFSEFLIVADTRPLTSVASGKFDALQGLLDEHAGVIGATVLSDLRNTLQTARTAFDLGNFSAASGKVREFATKVKNASGSDIPNVWRANSSVVNVAGELRASASTLALSLALLANQGS